MANFGWLHLTDLHVGQRHWLWPRMEETFFRDLDRLHSASGPWDLVFFTGDLVQTGSESEFQTLDQLLDRLWLRLRSLGSNPVLLAVPGNHDLVRPSALGSDLGDLADWYDQPSVRSRFWQDSTSDSRCLVNRAFENYMIWWRRTLFRPPGVAEGMLPGDISFTFEKAGLKIGIVGLNTTFLQLAGGDYRGKLDMHSLQFHDTCAGNGPAWANQHHLCILMTHQPPNWLTAEGREHLDGEIAVPGQFAVHLFGHQHDSRHDVLSQGGRDSSRVLAGYIPFRVRRRWGSRRAGPVAWLLCWAD